MKILNKIKSNKLEALWFISLIFAVSFKIIRIDTIPAGFNIDELGSVYDAWSLLNYGVDRWRMSWPVYFLNYGSGQNALYTYMLIPLFSLFGISQTVIHTPSLLSSFLLLFGGCGIIRLCWSERWGIGSRKVAVILYTILYGIAPYTQLSARFGLESLLMLGFSTFSIFLLMFSVKTQKTLFFVLTGIFFGLTLYTYAIAYIAVPVFLLIAAILLIKSGTVHFKNAIALAIPLLCLSIPLVLVQIVNIFGLDSILLGPFTIPRLIGYRASELSFSNIPTNLFLTIKSMLFFDALDYNTVEKYWTFYPVSVPFFFLGLIKHFSLMMSDKKSKWAPSSLVFIWFAIMLFIGCLLGKHGESGINPNTNKINGIFFSTMFYIVLGISYAFHNWKSTGWKKIAASLLVLLYTVFSVHFSHFYLHYFHPSTYWCHLFPDTIHFVEQSEALSQKPVYAEDYYISYLISSLPSPYEIEFKDNLTSQSFNNWHFENYYTDFAGLIRDNGKNASYLIHYPPAEILDYFESEGFQSYEEGYYQLFYCLK
ncbi:MAG: hypothetical protein IJ242_08695 [Clostridia bacterium]|nr:hypothetical protein [Clostridia bacterium]